MALDDPAQDLGVPNAVRAAIAQGPLQSPRKGVRRESLAKLALQGLRVDLRLRQAHVYGGLGQSERKLDSTGLVLAFDQLDPLPFGAHGERANLLGLTDLELFLEHLDDREVSLS